MLSNIAKDILNAIQQHDTIIIHTHENPDFDALGSQIGLKLALQKAYPNKQIYAIGELFPFSNYDCYLDTIDDAIDNDALAIVVDTGATHLLPSDNFKKSKTIIKIDHHLTGEDFGTINYVDTSAIAASQIIARLLIDNNFTLDSEIATVLMIGIIGDSGRFRYKGVNSETFEISAKLMQYDVDLQPIHLEMNKESIAQRRYRGYMAENFKITEHGVAYIKNTLEYIKQVSPDNLDISRNLIHALSDIDGCPIWLSLTEMPENEGIKVALRSASVPVNTIAAEFGGGGHALAAGAKVSSWAEADTLIARCDLALKNAD